nr:C40 family peptidase [Heyndrickxia coagulans]
MTRKKVLSVTAGMTLASLIVGSASTEAATYTVKKGDSLWKISQQYHTTVSQIKSDNHLTGDIIYPNQKFKVPSQTPKKYKIVSGDTLSAIAKKYGVKVSQLKEWNHLNSDLIYAGDILKINSSSATTSSTANSTGNSTANSTSNSTANNSTANNTTANSSTANNTAKSAATQKSTAPNGTYQIVKGDTLSGVAQKFGVTVSQLKEWNHLSSDWIVAGSALKVDGPSSAASSSNGSSTQSNQSSGTASSSSNAGSASSQTSGSSSTQSSSSNNSGSTTNSSQASQSSGAASSSSNAGSSSNGSSSSSSASTSSSQANSSRAVSKKVVSSSKSSSYSGSAVAQIAQKYIGAPYRFGGTTPAGFDCSGFVYYVLNEAGKSIGRLDAAGFYNNSYRVSNPQPGDLIFFENTYKSGISDVGIYLGNNQFISDSDKSVSIKSLSNSYWKSHFNSIRRLY